jgi:Brp/Blh family beta-carotene 15,15'-monooxygenase
VVAAPATAHEAEVAAIFAHLAPAAGAERAAAALAWAGMAAVPLLAVALAREARGRPGLAAELALIPAAAFLLPPLVHFLVYFCAVHSPRHFLSASAALGLGPGGGALAALPITLATLVGAGALAAALLAAGVPADAVALRAVFIGLAALTVPHMLLVDRVWRRAGAASP